MPEFINDSNFDEKIKEGKVVIDCYADWCAPCKMLEPVIEELDEEMKDIKFLKLNVDENQEKAGEYGIMSIPTMLFFKDGKKIEQFAGFMPKEILKERITEIFSNH